MNAPMSDLPYRRTTAALVAAIFGLVLLGASPAGLGSQGPMRLALDPCALGLDAPMGTTPTSIPASVAPLRGAPPIPIPEGSEWIVRGTVHDTLGNPLGDVAVTAVGTNHSQITNAAGEYRLITSRDAYGAAATAAIRARRIGYADAIRAVAVTGDSVTVDFVLRETRLSLQDIVVTGTTNPTEGIRVPFTVHQLNESSRLVSDQGSAIRAIQGRIAGAQVLRSGGQPGSGVYIELRTVTAGDAAARARAPEPYNREGYAPLVENVFEDPRAEPLSTFAIDVDRASYANVRRFLCEGRLPPKDAVRIEEMINYFSYDLPEPADSEGPPFAMHAEVSAAPWAPDRRLVRIGIQGRRMEPEVRPPSNLVFLLDVSGSMRAANKLPLVRQAMGLLVDELRDEDRVAIVVYAGAAGLVLPPTSGAEKETIQSAIDRLEAGGTTAGGAGIRLAYATAREHFVEGGNNRVILATDGDFNVGASSDGEMVELIERERESGVFLSVLGVGTGNLQDAKMEAIADHGNGNYAYLDNLAEARKVLSEEFESTLFSIAKDVKIQVEFNPERVLAYRLIGYENRLLAAEDFDDDTKDAGELGAGHSVTALYEVAVRGESDRDPTRPLGPLRYQDERTVTDAATSDELLFLRLRWKEPEGDESALIERPVRDGVAEAPSLDHSFASAVAGFGMLLRESEFRGETTLELVRSLAEAGVGADDGGWRSEFLELLDMYGRISGLCGQDCAGR